MNTFFETFIPKVAEKSELLNTADLKSSLDTEVSILFSNVAIYQDLLKWKAIVQHVTGSEIGSKAWISQFGTSTC